MVNKFLARVYEATGSVWAAVAMTWGSFMVFGGLPLMAAIAVLALMDEPGLKAFFEDPFNISLIPLPRFIMFVVMMLNFVIGMGGLWVATKFISHQRFFTLAAGFDRFRWEKTLRALLLWMGLLGAYSLTQYFIAPDQFTVSEDRSELIWWVIPGLILVPIQSTFEELAVRGQLLQGIGKLIPDTPFVPMLVTSAVFALLHGLNAEIIAFGFLPMMLQYFLFGLFLAAFTIMDEGLEIAIGVHVGNNLFAMFFVSYEGSSISTPSLFRQLESNSTNDLFGTLLMFFIVYLVFFGGRPHLLRMLGPQKPDVVE